MHSTIGFRDDSISVAYRRLSLRESALTGRTFAERKATMVTERGPRLVTRIKRSVGTVEDNCSTIFSGRAVFGF